ncbi:MAG: diaminopimelate decarboxylase [Acholeplasmatales bacterium]|nr:diaminopimelate decarboxylase [Acholeplasmatales bacterium]
MLIANVDVKKLKEKYDTPLYIYDANHIKKNISLYKNNFISKRFKTEIAFASKAFQVKEMLRLISKENLSLDSVSLGELYTAVNVRFPMNNVYFHGNNKSFYDLEYAIRNGVGHIVVDGLMELYDIEEIAKNIKKNVNILIRLNLGVDAHTHKFIVTSHVDSKFGVSYTSDEFTDMMSFINNSKYIKFEGFHSHIGSQIFDMSGFETAIEKLVIITKDFKNDLILNIGGGFGVKYTNNDKPIPLDIVSKRLISITEQLIDKHETSISKLVIEPGRSIVAEAGYTLYTIGNIKKTLNKLYYFIDGGMTDNIRPALYDAKYSADIVGKENELKNQIVSVAGKCCESGDIIIDRIALPKANKGDLMITYTTGAYGYTMSSNYNKALRPAVVFVEDGKDKLVVKRQTLEDLIKDEV